MSTTSPSSVRPPSVRLSEAFDHTREVTARALHGWLDAGWSHEGLSERLPRAVAERLLADADTAVTYQLGSDPPLTGQMLMVASAGDLGQIAAGLLGLAEPEPGDGLSEAGGLSEATLAAGQETANVLASAYLNGLGDILGASDDDSLLPTTPQLYVGETLLCWHDALRAQGEGEAERLVDWTRFATADGSLELYFLFAPDAAGLGWLTERGASDAAAVSSARPAGAPPAEAPPAEAPPAEAPPAGTPRQDTLLLADANLITRARLREAAAMAGLTVTAEAVADADAASAVARAAPTWAVLDLALPGAGPGPPSAVGQLSADSRWIALAPSSAPERLANAVAAGAWDFLLRPVSWPRLVALCERLAGGDGRPR